MKIATAAECRELDLRASRDFGLSTLLLMENAGAALARQAAAMLPGHSSRRVAVYCGKGNNGGDGLVAARHLSLLGCEARIFVAAGLDEMRGDAASNAGIVRRARLPCERLRRVPARGWPADLVIDAVLGTGLRGEVSGDAAVLVETIRRTEAPVLAADLPSGLDSDSGRLATLHVRAQRTLTLGLPKLGMLLYPGREAVGEWCVDPIGIPSSLLEHSRLRSELLDDVTVARWLPPRRVTANKGDAGRVFVIAGSEGMSGAAAMAAMAAVRGGAGLVTLGVARRLLPIVGARLLEVMTMGLAETETGAPDLSSLGDLAPRLETSDVLAIGPGLGRHPRTGELMRAVLSGWSRPAVVDADALNLLSPASRGTFPAAAVLTPHPGELARLRKRTIAAIEADRVGAVKEAARALGCVVLLKGAATLVADPSGRLAVNPTGTPGMATGGCGDVLTGLIAALLAQGAGPFAAAAAGAYLHGRAGERAVQGLGAGSDGVGMAAGDLLDHLPAARGSLAAARQAEAEPERN